MASCYMCESEQTTVEHVPPLCIFPEAKDTNGIDYRKNLITVPSCIDHNLRKSGDDEYLLFILGSNININSVGRKHYITKIRRAIKKRPTKIRIFRNPEPIFHYGISTGAFEVNMERLESQFDHIVRGLYFKLFEEQCHYKIAIASPLANSVGHSSSYKHNRTTYEIVRLVKSALQNEQRLGENPEVFYYQCKKNSEGSGFACMMVFYGGIEVVALSHPEKI